MYRLPKVGERGLQGYCVCVYSMSLPVVSNVPARFFKAYKQLKSDSSLHITKADKANSVVIIDKVDYNDKMYALLNDDSTYSKIRSNPLNTVNSQFNKKMKSLLKDHDDLIKQFSTFTPSLPYMYGLIKTHKDNNPARPIVSSIGSASYKLSKWLVNVLNPLVGNISGSHIKNNVDLIDRLNNVSINHEFILVSFDVCSLFTKVPVDDLLHYLADVLPTLSLPIPSNILLELIKLCIIDCKFEFNNEFFSQKFSMAICNPLSQTLSNQYMNFL